MHRSTRESPASPDAPPMVDHVWQGGSSSSSSEGGVSTPQYTRRLPVYLGNSEQYSFSPNDCLGRGGFGDVFKGFRKRDNLPVVLKRVALRDVRYIQGVPSEVYFHSRCKSVPGVAKLISYYTTGRYMWMVMLHDSNMTGMDLFIDNMGGLPEYQAQEVLQSIAILIQNLKNEGINHSDLKPANMLINPISMEVKIIDFGLARPYCNIETNCYGGTDLFLPPEVHESGSYVAENVVVWGLGLIYYYLLKGSYPFHSKRQIIRCAFPMPSLTVTGDWLSPFSS